MGKLVCITGPIAAGATTLAQRFTSLFACEQVTRKDVEVGNSFFARYGDDPQRYAFYNQLTFLCNSSELHLRLRADMLPLKLYVQDYTPFEHTEVYAHVLRAMNRLSQDEYDLLVRLTKSLEGSFIVPDVLVYRTLQPEQLSARVHGRGRPSEQTLDQEYLEALRQRFDEWAANWARSPVVHIGAELDVLADPKATAALCTRVASLAST